MLVGAQLVEDYQRDRLGRITQKVETTLDTLSASPVTHTYTYTYDLTGRLTGVQRDGAAWETYAYDGKGQSHFLDGRDRIGRRHLRQPGPAAGLRRQVDPRCSSLTKSRHSFIKVNWP
jgi:hypothetical protein